MAGFLEEWRKPSRLLQDVKTKSIERTLLPLIKQVRRWKSRSLDDWKIGWKVKIKVFFVNEMMTGNHSRVCWMLF